MSDALAQMRAEVGDASMFLDDPADLAGYSSDWTRKFQGRTPLVARPGTTEEVSRVLAACNRHRIPVVPQGGNTGMVGASVPRDGEVVINLSRMNKIEGLDEPSAVVQVEAGVPLQALQEYLADAGYHMPVDLGARGSCQIGGMIATNAGGIKVLRYGHMREQVFGLEVVLADGTIINSLNRLRKNNTGYDLKQMFIGSEGTLGIITRAVLHVHPQPLAVRTAMVGLSGRDKMIGLLNAVRARFRGLSSLEFVVREAVDFVRKVDDTIREPLEGKHAVYVVLEEETADSEAASDAFVERLAALMDEGIVADGIVAESEAQAKEIWRIREAPTETIGKVALTHKFDVTVPQGTLAPFMNEMEALAAEVGGFICLQYGHLGDGNVHVNMVQKPELSADDFHAREAELAAQIYSTVASHQGSISAEHGVGLMKRKYLHYSRNAEEIALMSRVKRMLDPEGIMNPGAILEAD